ncbi:nitrile hydratase subunit beta [Acuticoccus sp.]|uniref:nitrile hydratase subunit beta n=1 Tax=Acuticoccus sp. TaxID=1904378 RepID=UPI003B517321
MNGPADVGGAHGFGPVEADADANPFHADWERAAFALTLAMGAAGLWSIDRSRHMRETLPRTVYYGSSYYGIWLAALERLIAEVDLDAPPPRVLVRDAVRPAMARGSPYDRDGPAPCYGVGDAVRVRPMRPSGHTRAPGYLHGRVGRIAALHGAHVLPDAIAHGRGESPTPLYNVAFDARELWGEDTTADAVHADLFETYLEPAP